MNLHELFADNTLKNKAKTEFLSTLIIKTKIDVNQVIEFAKNANDPIKATCIEALEFATKQHPTLLSKAAFNFVIENLTSKAPRIKWESAKVIGNTAHLHPTLLADAITNLLKNTEDDGTVVRWSAAFALSEIIKLKTKHNQELIPAIAAIINREEKNSIKKIYQNSKSNYHYFMN